MTQVSEEIESRVTKKLSQDFSWTESRILGASFKLDVILLNPQVRTFSETVLGTSRNNDVENREPTADRSQNDPRPEVEFLPVGPAVHLTQTRKRFITLRWNLELLKDCAISD